MSRSGLIRAAHCLARVVRPRERRFPGPLTAITPEARRERGILPPALVALSFAAAFAIAPHLRQEPAEEPPREAYVGLASESEPAEAPRPAAVPLPPVAVRPVVAAAVYPREPVPASEPASPLELPVLAIDEAALEGEPEAPAPPPPPVPRKARRPAASAAIPTRPVR